MKKLVVVAIVLAASLVMAANENGLPDVLTAISTRKSVRKFDPFLAAHGLGLGAVWTGVYPGEERIAAVREGQVESEEGPCGPVVKRRSGAWARRRERFAKR